MSRSLLREKVLVIALVCFSFSTNAQLKFEGIVRDSISQPLEMASIVLLNSQTKEMASYGLTTSEGKFSLKVSPNTNYNVQISFFGLRTLKDSVQIKEIDFYKEYDLRNDIVLEEVVVKLPVSVRGDTIVYDADSFKNGSERKLEDIIANLPGVELNENDQIEVEGKVVNKLLVNGKEFFEGDTKLGTKNIPSNVVDKIQVLRNYSEVGQLNSVRSNQDNVAINIQLKKGKDNFIFGDIKGGFGKAIEDELYLAQPKIFYYSPDFTLNFIGDLNNLGEIALSRRDIRGLTGTFRQVDNRSGSNINLGNNEISFNTNENNAQEITNRLGSTSFSYSPNPGLDITGFLIYNQSDVTGRERRLIQYTSSLVEIPDESTDQISDEATTQAIIKLGTSYKPNFNNQIDYDIYARFSDDSQNLSTLSSVLGNTIEKQQVSPFRINQSLNYYLTIDEKNILSSETQLQISEEDPFYNAIILGKDGESSVFTNTAQALGFKSSEQGYNIGQSRVIKSTQIDSKIEYYHILSNKANLNFTAGVIRSHQEFDSDLFQNILNTEFRPSIEDSTLKLNNETIYDFSDYYLSAHLRLRAGIFTIVPGLSLRRYQISNEQFGEINSQVFTQVLPDFETKMQFKTSESLTFNYRIINQFTDVSRIAQGLVMNNYNSFQYGEPELTNGLSHNLSLLYNSFNLFNNTNVFVRAGYTKNLDQIRSITDFDNIIRTSTFFNSQFADESTNLSGRIQKTVGRIRLSTRASINYSKLNQFIQGVQSLNTSLNRSISPAISTNFPYAPNLRLSYNYGLTTNNQGSRETEFKRNSITSSFDAYIKKKITFNLDYSYNAQDDGINERQFFQSLNASLFYRKDKDAKLEYEIRGSNLLNIDAQVRNSANNLLVFSAETFILPRFISLRFIYNL